MIGVVSVNYYTGAWKSGRAQCIAVRQQSPIIGSRALPYENVRHRFERPETTLRVAVADVMLVSAPLLRMGVPGDIPLAKVIQLTSGAEIMPASIANRKGLLTIINSSGHQLRHKLPCSLGFKLQSFVSA